GSAGATRAAVRLGRVVAAGAREAFFERAHQIRRDRLWLGLRLLRGDLLTLALALDDALQMRAMLVAVLVGLEVDAQLLDHRDGAIDLLTARLLSGAAGGEL